MMTPKLTDPTAAARLAAILAPALRRVAKRAATPAKVAAQEDDHARHRTAAAS